MGLLLKTTCWYAAIIHGQYSSCVMKYKWYKQYSKSKATAVLAMGNTCVKADGFKHRAYKLPLMIV